MYRNFIVEVNMKTIVMLIVLIIAFNPVPAAPNDAAGEETVRWTPSGTVDGIPIIATLKWKTTRYLGAPAFEAIIKCNIAESYVSIGGKRYTASELGEDRFKSITVKSDWSALVDVISNGEPLGSMVLSNGNTNLYNVDGSDFGSAGLMGIKTHLSDEHLAQAHAKAPLTFKNFRFTKLSFYISPDIKRDASKVSSPTEVKPAVAVPPASTAPTEKTETRPPASTESIHSAPSGGIPPAQEKARLDEQRRQERIAAEKRQKEEREAAQASALASAVVAAAPMVGNIIDSTDLFFMSVGYSYGKTDYVSERGILAEAGFEVVDTHSLGFGLGYAWLIHPEEEHPEFEKFFMGYGFDFSLAALLFAPGNLGMRVLLGGLFALQINDNLVQLVVSAGINTGTLSVLESLTCIRYTYLFDNWLPGMGSGIYISAGIGGDWKGEKRLQISLGYLGFKMP